MPSIGELVRDGQEIVVQVVKDPIGTKGARLTTQLSIPSRYLVLLPYSKVLGVSVRIEDETERTRLKDIARRARRRRRASATSCAPTPKGESREALAEDIDYLGKLWTQVQENIATARVGERVYDDLSLPLRALRDLMRPTIEKVRVDSRETLERAAGVRRGSSCRSWPSASNIIPASGRSSICTASRTRSSARCARTCR